MIQRPKIRSTVALAKRTTPRGSATMTPSDMVWQADSMSCTWLRSSLNLCWNRPSASWKAATSGDRAASSAGAGPSPGTGSGDGAGSGAAPAASPNRASSSLYSVTSRSIAMPPVTPLAPDRRGRPLILTWRPAGLVSLR